MHEVRPAVRRSSRARAKHLLLLALACWAGRPALGFDPLAGDYSKDDPLDVRIVSYNHHGEFIETPSRDAAFHRILTALNPDIICFQEFGDAVSAATIANRLDTILPVSGGSWQIHLGLLGGIRTVIASRYPLTMTRTDTIPASSTRGVTIALADLPDADYDVDVYLLGVHLKCCGEAGGSEDASRQDSADAIANWLGDARGVTRPSGNNVVLPADTPMISLGDFNLVGGPQPEDTLITGDIQDEGEYGSDVKGDWDVSDMTDLHPTDPFTGDDFTWQGSYSYPPSRLDRFFFTDSVVTVANSFILNTDTMTPAALSAAGLQATDTLPDYASDHLPLAMDLRLASTPECTGDPDCDDDLFCNGAEYCDAANECQAGSDPCPGQMCRESDDACVNCLDDADCTDGVFCNGAETCDANGDCQPGPGDPCPPQFCRESDDTCVDCFDNSDCDDDNPCNGVETCEVSSGACLLGACESQVVVLEQHFDSDAGTFTYQDDTFRDTSNPSRADGSYESSGGLTGGGVRVVLGPLSTNMSGGWVCDFDITGAPTSIDIELAFRLLFSGGYESDEHGQALLSVDDDLIGVSPNDYLYQFSGIGSGDRDSGWRIESFSLSPAAGAHQIIVGGYNDKSTSSSEITEVFFDDVSITASYAAQCQCADGLFCNGQETCVEGACQPGTFPCQSGHWCKEDGDECIAYGTGDFEPDGDVDLVDFGALQDCFGLVAGPDCQPANLTGDDGLVDVADFILFAAELAGP